MKASRGFTLLEVVISVFMLGVMLIMLQAILQSATLVRVSKNQGIALSIAKNELEYVRSLGYALLPGYTTFSDSLVSTLPTAATTTFAVSTYNTKAKQVTVSVVWLDPGSSASSTVTLSTIIAQTGGLP